MSLSLEDFPEGHQHEASRAVKAALVRARANVDRRKGRGAPTRADVRGTFEPGYAPTLTLFNDAPEWEALRALFGEETRLDVVSRYPAARGRRLPRYFTRYAVRSLFRNLRAEAGLGRRCSRRLRCSEPASSSTPRLFHPTSIGANDRIGQVRDFRYVPYIADEAIFEGARASSKSVVR